MSLISLKCFAINFIVDSQVINLISSQFKVYIVQLTCTVGRSLNVVGGRVLVLVVGKSKRVPRIDGAVQQEYFVGDQVSAAVHHVRSGDLSLNVVRIETRAIHIYAEIGEKSVFWVKKLN